MRWVLIGCGVCWLLAGVETRAWAQEVDPPREPRSGAAQGAAGAAAPKAESGSTTDPPASPDHGPAAPAAPSPAGAAPVAPPPVGAAPVVPPPPAGAAPAEPTAAGAEAVAAPPEPARAPPPDNAAPPSRPEGVATYDAERAPALQRPPPPSGPFARLALGVQVALLTDGDASDLRLPSYAHLDLGYAFSPGLALLARIGTWLSFTPVALDFVGAGASFGFAPDDMFATVLLGASLVDDRFGLGGEADVQGLAAHLELGQRWVLEGQLYFELGAHFELGTPLFASAGEFVSIGVGPFLSVRWGG